MINLEQLLGTKFFTKRGFARSAIIAAALMPTLAKADYQVVGNNVLGTIEAETLAPVAGNSLIVGKTGSVIVGIGNAFHATKEGQYLIVLEGGILHTTDGTNSSVRFDSSGRVVNGGIIGVSVVAPQTIAQSLILFGSGARADVTNTLTGVMRGQDDGNFIYDNLIMVSDQGGTVVNAGSMEQGINIVAQGSLVLAVDKTISLTNTGSIVTSGRVILSDDALGHLIFDNAGGGSVNIRGGTDGALIGARNALGGSVIFRTSASNQGQATGAISISSKAGGNGTADGVDASDGNSVYVIDLYNSTSTLTVNYTSSGALQAIAGAGGSTIGGPGTGSGGAGGFAIGFDVERHNASAESVINLLGGTTSGTINIRGANGGNTLQKGAGAAGGIGGQAMGVDARLMESAVTLNVGRSMNLSVIGGNGGSSLGALGAVGGAGGRADLYLAFGNTAGARKVTIGENATVIIRGGNGGTDGGADEGAGGAGGAAYGIYAGNATGGDLAGTLTYTHTSTGTITITGGAGGAATDEAGGSTGGAGGLGQLIVANSATQAIDIDLVGSGGTTVTGGGGGRSTAAGTGAVGGISGSGGAAGVIDLNGATGSINLDFAGATISARGGSGGASNNAGKLGTGLGGAATHTNLATTTGALAVNINNAILSATGGAGGRAEIANSTDVGTTAGAGGAAIGMTFANSTSAAFGLNILGVNSQLSAVGGLGGTAVNHAGNGGDATGLNLSLGAGSGATVVNEGAILAAAGAGGSGAVSSGSGGGATAIKIDTVSAISMTNRGSITARGGTSGTGLLGNGGNAIAIDGAGATAALTIDNQTGSILEATAGTSTQTGTGGNATGIITGSAADQITVNGRLTVTAGKLGNVLNGTGIGISTQGGNDVLTINGGSVAVEGVGAPVIIDLGAGDDTLNLQGATLSASNAVGVTDGTITGGANEDTFVLTDTTGTTDDPTLVAGTFADFEHFDKKGTGVVRFTAAAQAFSDTIEIHAGTLDILTGTTIDANGTFDIKSGGTVSGAGTIDIAGATSGITVESGGTLDFGGVTNGVGNTLTVVAGAGKDVDLSAGSTIAVTIEGNGTPTGIASKIDVTGGGDIDVNGATSVIVKHQKFIADGTVFVIGTAATGTISNAGNLSKTSALFNYGFAAVAAGGGQNLQLTLNRESKTDVITTLQTALGRTLTPDEKGITGDIVSAVANSTNASDTTTVGQYLRGIEGKTPAELASHVVKTVDQNQAAVASAVENTVSAGVAFATGVNTRMDEVASLQRISAKQYANPYTPDGPNMLANVGGGFGLWAEALAARGTQDSVGVKTGYETTTYGIAIGLDYQMDNTWAFGVTGGYTTSDTDSDSGLTATQTDTLNIGAHATYNHNDWYLKATLGLGMGDIDSTQTVAGTTYNGSTTSTSTSMAIGAGYHIAIDDYWTVVPNASVNRTDITVDGYSTGIQSFSQTTNESTSTTLGAKLIYESDEGYIVTTSLGWKHEFGDTDRTTTVKTIGGSFYEISGITPSTDNIVAGIGVAYLTENDVTVKFGYDLNVGDGYMGHALTLGVKIGF